MLTFAASSPESVLWTITGHFMSDEEMHMIHVKRHGLDIYAVADLTPDDSEYVLPELEIPIQASILAACKFTLPGSSFDNIALVSEDLTLIVFLHSETSEEEFPFDRIVSDKLKYQHVLPIDCPAFMAVENRLFVSVYPNSLSVITFTESGIQKNEVRFLRYLPIYIGHHNRNLVSIDVAESVATAADSHLKAKLTYLSADHFGTILDETSADNSAAFEGVDLPATPKGMHCFGDSVYIMYDEKMVQYNMTEVVAEFEFENTSGYASSDLPYVAFKDGDIVKFEDGKFTAVTKIEKIFRISKLNDSLLLCDIKDLFMVVDTNTKNVYTPFEPNIESIAQCVVVPHTVIGADKVIANCESELRAYGLGFPFTASCEMEVDGDEIFAAGKYVVVSKNDSSVLLEGPDVVEVDGFVTDQATLLFCELEPGVFVQITREQIVVFGKQSSVMKIGGTAQHASQNGGMLAVALSGTQEVVVYKYASELSEEKRMKIGDDVSALHITTTGYLICSTWNGMKLQIYNIESGASKEFGSNLIVRSMCEVGGVIYIGTSSGDVHALMMNEEGGMTEVAHKTVSASTVSVSPINIDGKCCVYVATEASKVIELVENKLSVYPTTAPANCLSHVQDASTSILLTSEGISMGVFESAKVILAGQKRLERTAGILTRFGEDKIAVLAEGRNLYILTIDMLEQTAAYVVPKGFIYNGMTAFTVGGNMYIQFCTEQDNEKHPDEEELDQEPHACDGTPDQQQQEEETEITHTEEETNPEESAYSPEEEEDFGPDRFSGLGYLLTFKVTPTGLVANEPNLEYEVLATNSRVHDKFLYVTVGSMIKRYEIRENEDFLQFVELNEAQGMMVSTDIAIDHGKVAIFDIFGSAAVYNAALDKRVKDGLAKGICAGCFAGDKLLLASDVRANVYTLSIEQTRIRTIGWCAVGAKVTSLGRWKPLPDAPFDIFVGGSNYGGIIVIAQLTPDLFAKFDALQKRLGDVLEENNGMSNKILRSVASPSYCLPPRGFIDGDLLREMDELDEEQRQRVLQDVTEQELESVLRVIRSCSF